MKHAAHRSEPRHARLERKILELERTVQLLEEARSHYADHYDFAPTSCVTLDGQGCILELNVAAAKLLGRERAQLAGLPLLPFVEKADAATFLNHLRRCKSTREKQVCEIALGPRAGACRLIEVLSVPVVDTQTGRTVFRSVLRDITAQRHAERALRLSEERFATAFRASPSAIAISTLKEGCFIDVNASFCKLTAYTRKEVLGRTSLELGIHADAAAREARIATLRDTGTLAPIEYQIPTKSGEPRDVLVSAELIELEGRQCLLTIGQDVTELKRLQREVLEISEREQSRIGRDLHDGPCQSFTGIGMLAEVVARDLDREHAPLAAKMRDISRMVREGADEMRRLAAGLFPVKVGREGLAFALQDFAAETTARCDVTCSFTMPAPITIADENTAIHLYRIAQEAVANAIRHGKARQIEISLRASDGNVSLGIRDDGRGLPEKLGKKAGIGLHSMEYRARMIGGSLEVGAAEKRGTLVTCRFPGKKVTYVEESASS